MYIYIHIVEKYPREYMGPLQARKLYKPAREPRKIEKNKLSHEEITLGIKLPL